VYVSNRGIVTAEVLRRDLVDGRIIVDRMQGGAQPADILGVWSDEDVDIFGGSSDPVKVDRDSADDDIVDRRRFE